MCPSLFIYFKCSSARRTLADGHARREAVVRLARGHAIAHVGTVSLRHCSCSGCKRCDRVNRSGLQARSMSYHGVQLECDMPDPFGRVLSSIRPPCAASLLRSTLEGWPSFA